jgi:hypothetical protein
LYNCTLIDPNFSFSGGWNGWNDWNKSSRMAVAYNAACDIFFAALRGD